jgi:hypothetical protein
VSHQYVPAPGRTERLTRGILRVCGDGRERAFVVLRPRLPHRPPYLPAGVLFSPSSRQGATLLVFQRGTLFTKLSARCHALAQGGTLFTKLSARCHALALCFYGRALVERSGLSLWIGVTQCMPRSSLGGQAHCDGSGFVTVGCVIML